MLTLRFGRSTLDCWKRPKKYSTNFTKKEKDKAKREASQAHKEKLKDFAVEKFGVEFRRKKDWDKADALLIAEWCRLHHV